jgi:ubiquinone biosynthesis protein
MAIASSIVELPAEYTQPSGRTSRYRRREIGSQGHSRLSKDEWSLNRPVQGGFFSTLWRVLQILSVGLWFFLRGAIAGIYIRGKHRRTEFRAALLRRAFDVLGGAFVKIGQQLSLRQDMLPPEYCDALSELLDNVKEFDFCYARQTIQAQIKRPIEQIFTGLDPKPIGRASIACVYQAWLCDEFEPAPVRVAIKVRRPGIVELFAADLRALDWIMITLEYFTIMRGGVSRTFRGQLREILFDEVDFRIEARYQEIFRREYRKHKSYRVTAPRVFYRYSGKDVMVSEYVDAIPLESIISAVETRDAEYMEYLRSLGIHPVRLAKRILRYNFHAFFEDVFFHGDPHPANIMVLPRNKLVFIDFGACGTFSKRDRHMMLQMHHSHAQKDIRGMVQSVIALMEPLPPIDVDEFRRKLEKQYWDGYYGLLSKHSDWRDRTSYRLWVALFDLVREYHIPMPLNMMRMIRATLLYDTIVAHLDNRIDVFKEFRVYERTVARRMQVRLFRDATRQALCGPDLHWYLTFNRIFEMGRTALFRVQKFLDEPLFSFAGLASKVYFTIMTFTRWLVSVSAVSSIFVTFIFWRYHFGHKSYLSTIGDLVSPNAWSTLWSKAEYSTTLFFFVLAIITFAHINALRLRFSDPDL